jgi:methionyl-tRNA formyltransferase
LAALNVHPSLLPDKRGPDPLFWTLRDGSGAAGVTVHRLSERFDAGPILAREGFTYRDGTTEPELEHDAAQVGAGLLLRALDHLEAGTAEWEVQEESLATYAPWPEPEDYVIDTLRPARAAYNFLHGVAGRGEALFIRDGSTLWRVIDVLGYQLDEPESRALAPDAFAIRFEDGYLVARAERVDENAP